MGATDDISEKKQDDGPLKSDFRMAQFLADMLRESGKCWKIISNLSLYDGVRCDQINMHFALYYIIIIG